MIDRDDEMREGNERALGSFSFSFSSALNAAAAVKRASFSCFYSGRYLFNSLNNCVTVFLSSVCENWAMAGGTLRRWCIITFCHWRRTYSGHLMKRVRSAWGRMSWPEPKLSFRISRERRRYNNAPIPTFLPLGPNKRLLIYSSPWCEQDHQSGGFLACSGFGLGQDILSH